MSQTRRYLELFLVAAISSAITLATPAMARVVADFAKNADKVDGRHAAPASSTASKRRNKVATYAKSGFLPNNALKRAPDADKLDGKDSAAFVTQGGLSGAVLPFNLGSCPAGWSELEAARGRYVVGLHPAGTLAAVMGTPLDDLENRVVGQHDHATSSHGHAASMDWGYDETPAEGTTRRPLFGFRPADIAGAPDVAVVATSSVDVQEAGTVTGTNAPYIQLLMCQKG